MTKILVLFGGGSSEHEISELSSKYIIENLNQLKDTEVYTLEMDKEGKFHNDKKEEVFLTYQGIKVADHFIQIDYVVPCIHGYPGETGDIQSLLEIYGFKYFGVKAHESQICFNKVTTKLWFDALSIPNTEFAILAHQDDIEGQLDFFKKHQDVFIKAASQGSSVGCYHVTNEQDFIEKCKEAFKYSTDVLIEKKINGRELEIAAYEYQGEIHATVPGEICVPSGFYTYEEKYDSKSETITHVEAPDISKEIIEQMRSIALKAFRSLKLKDLSRIDFFLTDENEILLNEINTFPGMTPISMFPKMMENNGLKFSEYLQDRIQSSIK